MMPVNYQPLLFKSTLLLLLFLISARFCDAQTQQRLRFTSISSNHNTGQDYTPWLNDNLDSLVQQVWQNNFIEVDVKLQLQSHSKITRIQFYDYEGVFTDRPDSLYALNGSQKTYLGLFTGETYKTMVDLILPQPVEADAIIIHKYSNNIPQKIFAYGYVLSPAVAAAFPAAAPVVADSALVKIPIDAKRWYQLNNSSDGLQGLFDGITSTDVQTGWGKMFSNYEAYYPVPDGAKMNLYKVKLFDGAGSLGPYPFTMFAITGSGAKVKIGTFTGDRYNGWVGPYPDRQDYSDSQFKLDTAITDIKYLVLNCWYMFPTEIEFYGTYQAGPAPGPLVKRPVKLKQFFGVNAFEWDFLNHYDSYKIDESSIKAVESFTQVRHYIDWEKLESNQGSYTFSPVHSGGWNYDAIYQRCKQDNVEILACIKTLPNWMLNTYPDNQRDSENVPVIYGKDFADPNSYLEQAKVAFQYAARYGSGHQIDTALLHVNGSQRWTGDQINTVKVGMGLIKYIECDNERDKWWKGRKGYQTGYEYAANLSAFYDGNKNTMGPGVGVKNADPEIKVVMAGLALANTDYVRAMIDWCKIHRGFKADGSVNLCWDVINYHLYSNDSKKSQNGYPTRGTAPEVSEAQQVAADFVNMAHEYAADMPVWITEVGYDVNQGSPYKAIPIGDKTPLQTQADWILRSSLMYARSGIERIFFYQLYDDNVLNPTQFGSSGLINQDKTRKPAADFLYQTNKLIGEYTYKETLSSDPLVDRYELNGNPAYVLTIPDEKGRTASYTLDLPGADSVKIYTPTIGSDTMAMQKMKLLNGKYTCQVTETPSFVMPVYAPVVTGNLMSTSFNSIGVIRDDRPTAAVKLYPNPTSNFLNIDLNSQYTGSVNIMVSNINSGVNAKKYSFQKADTTFSERVDISSLPFGVYLVTIQQGTNVDVKRVTKLF